MLMTPQPVFDCMADVQMHHQNPPHRIYLSPRGKVLTAQRAEELSQKSDLVVLCGHYEGVDQRIIDTLIDEELSIGDYVLTGGAVSYTHLSACFFLYNVPELCGYGISCMI